MKPHFTTWLFFKPPGWKTRCFPSVCPEVAGWLHSAVLCTCLHTALLPCSRVFQNVPPFSPAKKSLSECKYGRKYYYENLGCALTDVLSGKKRSNSGTVAIACKQLDRKVKDCCPLSRVSSVVKCDRIKTSFSCSQGRSQIQCQGNWPITRFLSLSYQKDVPAVETWHPQIRNREKMSYVVKRTVA